MLAGRAVLVLGALIHLLPSIPLLGRLPGDLRIERPGFRLYVPLPTSLLLGLLRSGLFWIVSKLR